VRRNQRNAQTRHLDPSITPGEGQARKPKFLVTKRQAQQQCVYQQGEQQRKHHSPAFTACTSDHPLPVCCGSRTSLRRRIRGGFPHSDGDGQRLYQPNTQASGPVSPPSIGIIATSAMLAICVRAITSGDGYFGVICPLSHYSGVIPISLISLA
jgi:hypothetical protein